MIGAAACTQRADKALAEAHPRLSRRTVQMLCERGRVWLDNRRLKKSDTLRAGDRVTVMLDAPRIASPAPALPLAVRFESGDWLVLAKPAGQPSAPQNGDERCALANSLVAHYPEVAAVGYNPLEPGLLHRLDNGTSGLLVAARNQAAFEVAAEALRNGCWNKRYLAIVCATDLPGSGCIRGRLVANRRCSSRVQLDTGSSFEITREASRPPNSDPIRSPTGKSATHETHFWVNRRLAGATLVEVSVSAAFRHQIRAHFARAGWPLLNDEVYGAPRDPRLAVGRHALHAARVAWAGTCGFAGFDVFEPLPLDLASCLDAPQIESR